MKSVRMRLTEHVARMGAMKNAFTILSESLNRRYHFEDLCVDGRKILKLILK
jgi:hypothetical protein